MPKHTPLTHYRLRGGAGLKGRRSLESGGRRGGGREGGRGERGKRREGAREGGEEEGSSKELSGNLHCDDLSRAPLLLTSIGILVSIMHTYNALTVLLAAVLYS